MILKTSNPKYKLRVTRCYLVELVDKNENIVETDIHGMTELLDEYCFGTKEDAIKTGERLLYLKETENTY